MGSTGGNSLEFPDAVVKWWFNGGLMGFKGGLKGVSWGLMGFNGV